jgi:hypothetical protein
MQFSYEDAKSEMLNESYYPIAFLDSWPACLAFAAFSGSSSSAEEGRNDKKYPAREGEKRMDRTNALELASVSAFTSKPKLGFSGKRGNMKDAIRFCIYRRTGTV